jgi:hypothetical protein
VHLLTDHVIETQPDVDRKQNAVRGDGPENYFYFAVTPPIESGDPGVRPPLALNARQMGLDILGRELTPRTL